MRPFLQTLKPGFIALVCFTILLGGLYPMLIWSAGRIFFHKKAQGSLLYDENGKVLGSSLIAQAFTKPRYFHPRPSHAGSHGYDAANSSGSNLGQTSQELIDVLTLRAKAYRSENGLSSEEALPVDAITASGSGLDPHISLENARIQAKRVAKARGLSLEQVLEVVSEFTEEPVLKILGTKCVNVLSINYALDRLY